MTTFVDSTLEDRCLRYRREFQLPAVIDPTSRHILLYVGARCGAVTMPTELGEQVRQRLRLAGIAGPVVAHPRARRWTFLTGPTQPDSISVTAAAELFRLYTTVACGGSQIVLPSPEDERTGYRTWVQSPQTTADRPPQSFVVDAARDAGASRTPGR